jgi:HD-like signal output (HDOD) protein
MAIGLNHAEPMSSDPLEPDHTAAFDRQLEASLRDIGIPPRPRILELVNLEIRADEPDMNYLTQLIMGDVALAAGLIKTANSPFFGYRQKTRNVRDALAMLGLKTASNAIAGLILRRVIPPSPNLERFWDASERTAQLSAWLVQKVGVRYGITSDAAYTYALFRDCGIPILMRRFSGYKETLSRANADASQLFTVVEEIDVPTNHAVVGGLMAQSWWLPEDLCIAIRRHHDVSAVESRNGGVPGASSRQIALAQLAEKLHQSKTGMNMTREWDKMGRACLAVLELGEDIPPELLAEASEFIETMADY